MIVTQQAVGMDMGRVAKDLGSNVTKLRIAAKVSMNQLAARLGVTSATISRLEAGKVWISEKLLMAIANEFGVRPHELLSPMGHVVSKAPQREITLKEATDRLNKEGWPISIKLRAKYPKQPKEST